jgi:CheY-like chemotaxis protein
LLSNAIKFSSPGGEVTLSAIPSEGWVTFTVADQGRGIPADQLDAVFDRFQQVDSSDARDKNGTGLGLPISRGIVEQHGGRIWVSSTPGKGATFAFTLPLDEDAKEPSSGRSSSISPQPRGVALICDNDPDVVDVLATMLETHGQPTLRAHSGPQAIDLARRHQPAVIVLDLMMPGMSGWDTLTELRNDPDTADIPVVILSARGPEGAPGPEVSDWLTKPIDLELLLRTLRHATATDTPPTVLVVEDDAELTQVLAAVLESHGVNTVVAETGRDAVAISADLTPALVVLDLGLPDIDGYAVIDAMRQDPRLCSTPLVVYTGADLDEADRTRLRLGETRFLAKGRISPAVFELRVLGLLERIMSGSAG